MLQATTPTAKPPSRSVSTIASASRRKAQRAVLLKNRIALLRRSFPEFKNILQAAIDDLHHETTRNPESDVSLVVAAVHCGAWTIAELLDELPTLRRKALKRILDSQVATGNLITARRHTNNERGGPPETLYIPAPVTSRK